jgi:hypothetical protein
MVLSSIHLLKVCNVQNCPATVGSPPTVSNAWNHLVFVSKIDHSFQAEYMSFVHLIALHRYL